MNKDLKVLAECVDIRNGKRFKPGEEFLPAPTLDQADRLIKAGCLPEGARALAEKTAKADEKEAEAALAKKRADEEAALAFSTAQSVKAAADLAAENAKAALAKAVKPEDRAAAEKGLAASERAAKTASDELAKLTK